MTWNILLLSSKPNLPSARFHLGDSVLFAFVLTPPGECPVSVHDHQVCCFALLSTLALFMCLCMVHVRRLGIDYKMHRTTSQKLHVCDLGLCLHFFGCQAAHL